MSFDVWKQAKIMNGFDKLKSVPSRQENTDTTLEDLKKLSGITPQVIGEEINISITGTEKAQLMKKHNIRPGTPEWFQLWFSKPYLTGEQPVGNKHVK
jgi:hypothetical protein